MDQQPVLRDGRGTRWVTAVCAGELLRRAEEAEARIQVLEEALVHTRAVVGISKWVSRQTGPGRPVHSYRIQGIEGDALLREIDVALASEGIPEEAS